MNGIALRRGFTIVELLIVIVVIAVLAAISIVAYTGVQDRARQTKIDSDIRIIEKAVVAARSLSGKTLIQITGTADSVWGCVSQPTGTNLANLARSHSCWQRYDTTLRLISEASSIDITGVVDPWGRPYSINENEGEAGDCTKPDRIGVYTQPFVTGYGMKYRIDVPLSGYCS